jgi:hypothetical protein
VPRYTDLILVGGLKNTTESLQGSNRTESGQDFNLSELTSLVQLEKHQDKVNTVYRPLLGISTPWQGRGVGLSVVYNYSMVWTKHTYAGLPHNQLITWPG